MIDTEELVRNAMPSIIQGFKDEVRQSITWQVKQDAAKMVSEHVQAWITANVLPEVTVALVEAKDGFVAMGPQLAQTMVDELTKSLSESFKKKMEQSWERNAIFKACFGA